MNYINFRNLINEPEYLRNVCKFIYPELENKFYNVKNTKIN